MSEELIGRLRTARKITVEVGHITFIGVCPTYSKLMRIVNDKHDDSPDARMAALAINNWQGVTAPDIVDDGDPEKLIPYSENLYQELIFDRADWWKPISIAITQSVLKRQMMKENEIKNSLAGTTHEPLKDSPVPGA